MIFPSILKVNPFDSIGVLRLQKSRKNLVWLWYLRSVGGAKWFSSGIVSPLVQFTIAMEIFYVNKQHKPQSFLPTSWTSIPTIVFIQCCAEPGGTTNVHIFSPHKTTSMTILVKCGCLVNTDVIRLYHDESTTRFNAIGFVR